MAEAVGFEPTVAFNHACFQDKYLRPLGHASSNSLGVFASKQNSLEALKNLGYTVFGD